MRRTVLTVIVPLALLLAAGFGPLPAQSSHGPRTVAEFTEAFVGAARALDADAASALVAEDVVMMGPDARLVEGREAFHALWSGRYEGRSGPNPLTVEVRDVLEVEDLAVVRGDYGPEGKDPVGQFVWTLERDDRGVWVLGWWIFNRKPA